MWSEFLGYARRIFTLQRTVEQLGDRLGKAESDLERIRLELRSMADAVRDYRHEQERDRAVAERDRENLLLRLENTILRLERGLPPPKDESGGAPQGPSDEDSLP